MILQSLRTFMVLTLLTGVIYPALVTGIAQAFYPAQAEGSLITNKAGVVVGSELIGQSFSEPKYLWGRMSATAPAPYNAAASSGSNLGVNNPNLHMAVKVRVDTVQAADPEQKAMPPVDLVTASASGLDPHISVMAAEYQISRIAKARNLSYDRVKEIIEQNIQTRQFGILGEPVVNVLKTNLALDQLNEPNRKP